MLTQASNGCGYSGGLYSVEVGNFPTAWAVGDVLVVDLIDLPALEAKTIQITLAGDFSEVANVVLEAISPQTLAITPVDPTVQVPNTQQFTATATFAEVQGDQDVTASATWLSSSATTGTISTVGLFTPGLVGTSDITATLGGVPSNTSTVTVTAGAPAAGVCTVAANPTTGVAASDDGSSASTVTVTAKDANGNAVAGKTVNVTLDKTTTAYINGVAYTAPVDLSGTTDASGVATFLLSSSVAETVTATIKVDGVS